MAHPDSSKADNMGKPSPARRSRVVAVLKWLYAFGRFIAVCVLSALLIAGLIAGLPWRINAVIGLLLARTAFGFRVRLVGNSERVARWAGVSPVRTGVNAILLSGAMAGIAGSSLLIGEDTPGATDQFDAGYGFQGIAVAPHRLGEEGPRDHAVVGGVGEVLHHARRAVLYLPFEFPALGDLPLGVGPRRNLHHHIDETGFGDRREVGMVVPVSARCQILEGTAGDR